MGPIKRCIPGGLRSRSGMNEVNAGSGQLACHEIHERLKVLFPLMTFKVSPQNGTRDFRITLPGTDPDSWPANQ